MLSGSGTGARTAADTTISDLFVWTVTVSAVIKSIAFPFGRVIGPCTQRARQDTTMATLAKTCFSSLPLRVRQAPPMNLLNLHSTGYADTISEVDRDRRSPSTGSAAPTCSTGG